MVRRVSSLIVAGAVGGLLMAGAGPATAAYPGQPGLIAYSSEVTGSAQIWTVNVRTLVTHQLTTDGGTVPCWSPYGTQIAFQRGGDLWVMNADGSDARDITNTPNVQEDDPTWSPDGRQLAYALSGGGNFGDIAVINVDGSGQHTLTSDPAADYSPAWSSKNMIAFVSERSGSRQIWVMKASGKKQHNISNSDADDIQPAWSPNGKSLIFSSTRTHQGSVGMDLWLMNADGTGQSEVDHQTSYSDGQYPSFSPDGTTIEFSANNGLGSEKLWSYGLGTGVQTRLTFESGQTYDESGDWQPVHTAKVTLSPPSGAPNDNIGVTGAHFAAKEQVAVTFVQAGKSTTLATVTTDGHGKLSTTVTVPSTAAAGKAHIILTGQVSALTASEKFVVE